MISDLVKRWCYCALTLLFLKAGACFGAAPPPNDQCAGAIRVPSDGPFPYLTSIIPDISGATTSGDPATPTCVGSAFYGIWFAFRPSISTNYTFSVSADTATTVADTAMALYTASGECSGLTQFACNDDEGDLKSAISTNLTAGVNYYVLVWSIFDELLPGETAVQLRVSRPAVPLNDDCGGAEIIAGAGPFPFFSSTNDITRATETGDPGGGPTCLPGAMHSVWFRFTPTVGGNYFISGGDGTATTVNGTTMAIYTSTSACAGYTQVDCDSAEASRVSIPVNLTAGTRYYIVVWDSDPDSPTHGETSVQLAVTTVAKPDVATLPASSVTSTSARLNSAVNPHSLPTRGWFEWGTTTSYGTRTTPRFLGSGVATVQTNAVITGLTPGTIYHYRAVATNSLGTNFGGDVTFTWVNTRPTITSLQPQSEGGSRILFNGTSGQGYTVQASTDLITWTDLGAATDLGGGSFEFRDTAAMTRRFYRIKAP